MASVKEDSWVEGSYTHGDIYNCAFPELVPELHEQNPDVHWDSRVIHQALSHNYMEVFCYAFRHHAPWVSHENEHRCRETFTKRDKPNMPLFDLFDVSVRCCARVFMTTDDGLRLYKRRQKEHSDTP
jgi:hypothetical protein